MEKVKTVVEAEDLDKLRSKRKAINTFLLYAIWQERNGQPELLDTFLLAARASRVLGYMWFNTHRQFISTLLSGGVSPRALILVSPYIPWSKLIFSGGLIQQQWVAATCAVPYTEEVGQSVVDTVLQITSRREQLPHNPTDIWLWFTGWPSLPPVCLERDFGTYPHVVKTIRGLKDTEVLKSYLLHAWSQWNSIWAEGFNEICASIHEDLGGFEMGHHRVDLIQRLDYILSQLYQGPEHFEQYGLGFNEGFLQTMTDQYQTLREILLEMELKVITCESYPIVGLLCINPGGHT